MKGKVKTLMFNDLVGYNSDMAVYPVTSVLGVLDEDNTNLKTIIANLKEEIKNKADSTTSSSITTSFVPVIIRTSLANPSTPTGGSYNYATKTLTPPTGWEEGGITSTTTYLCIGVANSDTSVISWSGPYSSASLKGEKGDKGDKGDTGATGPAGSSGSGSSSGSTSSDEVGICMAYTHATSLPEKPEGGTYNASDKSFTVVPSTWKTSTDGLEKPIYVSIGIGHSKDSSIDWQTPFLLFSNTSDLPFNEVPQSNYATTFCYVQSTETLTVAPTGGSYNFDTGNLTEAPTSKEGQKTISWKTDKSSLTPPYYMSIGTVKRDANEGTTTITWSAPIYLTSADSLSQGSTPGTDNLTEIHVVIAYQNSTTTPTAPKATEGSVDFTTDPYTVTAPSGWFVEEDDDHKITDDTWCIIKKFQYKKNDDGTNAYATSNNSIEWSTPEKVSEATLSLSKKELDLVVGKMSVTANELETAVDSWMVTADNTSLVAKKVQITADNVSLVAGAIVTQCKTDTTLADTIISNSQYRSDFTTNAAGAIVTAITQDKDGLLKAFAENVVLQAKNAGNGEGSYIQLLAESASGLVASQLSVGTNAEGEGFIKAVAQKIDLFGLLKTNTIWVGGKVEGSDKDYEASSCFCTDGSGFVANGNIYWDKEGTLLLKGKSMHAIETIEITSIPTSIDKIPVINASTTIYTMHYIKNSIPASSSSAIVMNSFLFISGYEVGAVVKLIVYNENTGTQVLLGSNEGKNFKYMYKNGTSFKNVNTSSSSISELNGIMMTDGYYELVAIGNDTWCLTSGYSSYGSQG